MTVANKNQIYVIHSFMLDMGLKQSELLIYAILYSFTVAEAGLFYGSQRHLSYLSGLSARTVQRAIYSLIDKGYVIRTKKEAYKGIKCRLANDMLPSNAGVKCKEVKGEIASAEKKKESVTSCVTSEKTEEIGTLSKEKSADINIEEFGILSEKKSADINTPLQREKTEKGQALEITPHAAKSTLHADCRITPSLHPTTAASLTKDFLNYIGNSKRRVGRFVKYDVKGYGRYGFVGMTDAQYTNLLALVNSEVLTAYVRRLEIMLENNTENGPPPPHSAYKTLKKWIEEDYGV